MIAALFFLAAVSGSPEASAPASGPVVEVNWTQAPSTSDFIKAYPARAWDRQTSGRAVLSCLANENGKLSGCSVVSEDPGGLGFGAAALRLSSKFQLAPAGQSRSLAGGHIKFAINFVMPATR